MPHIAPSISQKCRQWSVSMMKLFADGAEECREDRQIGALPGHADKDVPKPQDDGDKHQRRVADAAIQPPDMKAFK